MRRRAKRRSGANPRARIPAVLSVTSIGAATCKSATTGAVRLRQESCFVVRPAGAMPLLVPKAAGWRRVRRDTGQRCGARLTV